MSGERGYSWAVILQPAVVLQSGSGVLQCGAATCGGGQVDRPCKEQQQQRVVP